MTLKANRPWIEFAALVVLIYFTVKFLLLTVEKGDPAILIPTVFFLTMGLVATFWTNKEYRNYDLGSNLTFKGHFWGQGVFDLKDLTGFKIKERKNTGTLAPLSEYDIVIHTSFNRDLTIRQDNYGSGDIKKFKERLEVTGVPFLGTEKFSWTRSFKDLLKLKFFE